MNDRKILALIVLAMLVSVGVITIIAQDDITTQNDLLGEWNSIACEWRPNSQYLERHLTFEEDLWFGVFSNYADPACETATLLFYIEGNYTLGASRPDIADGVIEGEFSISIIRLTPQEQGTLDFLNSSDDGDCGVMPWEMTIEQDITETGCSLLGVDLSNPLTEYEVVLVQDDYLFFGARPVDGSGINAPELRPTALQVPLYRVAEED